MKYDIKVLAEFPAIKAMIVQFGRVALDGDGWMKLAVQRLETPITEWVKSSNAKESKGALLYCNLCKKELARKDTEPHVEEHKLLLDVLILPAALAFLVDNHRRMASPQEAKKSQERFLKRPRRRK